MLRIVGLNALCAPDDAPFVRVAQGTAEVDRGEVRRQLFDEGENHLVPHSHQRIISCNIDVGGVLEARRIRTGESRWNKALAVAESADFHAAGFPGSPK